MWGPQRLHNSTRIALQILLNIPVLGRGVNYCIVSPRIKDLRSQLCFLSLPPSITVVSEKDNLIKNNKNFKYDSTALRKDDDESPMSSYRSMLRPISMLISALQHKPKYKSKFNLGFHAQVLVKTFELMYQLSITNVGLILTKPGWFLFSGYGQTDTVLESSYSHMETCRHTKKIQLKTQN